MVLMILRCGGMDSMEIVIVGWDKKRKRSRRVYKEKEEMVKGKNCGERKR